MLSTAAGYGYTPYKAVNIHHTRVVMGIEHLTNVLVSFRSPGWKGFCVRIPITAVAVMSNLLVLHIRPDFLFKKVKISHVLVPTAPRHDLLLHVRYRTFNCPPHAPIHWNAVVDVIS